MNSTHRKIMAGLVAFLMTIAAAELATHAQTPKPSKQPAFGAQPAPTTPAVPAPTSGTAAASAAASAPVAAPVAVAPAAQASAAMDAERQQIWNSPNMLRARAWLQEYCDRSAKITPEEKQRYMSELENLSPVQMKLWLLKFDQEEEARRQQYAFWEQANTAALSRARSADQAAQQSYSAINRAENQAAAGEQQQLNQEAADVQSNEQTKQLEGSGPYGPYGPYGYQGYGGGIHYHFHLYPY
jgi:hypothetical protein